MGGKRKSGQGCGQAPPTPKKGKIEDYATSKLAALPDTEESKNLMRDWLCWPQFLFSSCCKSDCRSLFDNAPRQQKMSTHLTVQAYVNEVLSKKVSAGL